MLLPRGNIAGSSPVAIIRNATLSKSALEPVFLTRLLDAQAERCPPFRLFFALTFSDAFGADHPNVTVTALGGAQRRAAVFRRPRRQRHTGQYFRY